jgi:hypothetical protein
VRFLDARAKIFGGDAFDLDLGSINLGSDGRYIERGRLWFVPFFM